MRSGIRRAHIGPERREKITTDAELVGAQIRFRRLPGVELGLIDQNI